jgi:Right handed beta helix region/Divergent InlB B-repeat domain
VKIAASVPAVVALVCAVGLAAPAAGSRAVSVSRNMVVVTTTADVVNGKTSSIAALNRKPGRDGISLREALLAADHTGGSATVYILFSPRLNGKTIKIRSELPPIHRDHMVVEGIAPNGAPARVTLDGRLARLTPPGMNGGELLLVQASEVTVRWLSFTGAPTQLGGLDVIPGQNDSAPPSTGPLNIANVQILDNVFTSPNGAAEGVVIGNSYFANAHVSGITIARNTFGVGTEGVLVGTNYPTSTAQGVVIEDNTIAGNEWGIELASNASTVTRQTGAQIIGNTITGGGEGITFDSGVNGTLIDDNTISDTQKPAITVGADAQIVNNVISANSIGLVGVAMTGGSVTIENNTLVDSQMGTLLNAFPAPGSTITDLTIRNSIFYDAPGWSPIAPSTGPYPSHRPDVVTNSLISGPDWAGTNGNMNGDPLFVNAAAGDYHLTAGSPAVNAGTTIRAPSYDLDGAARDALPDIGAFEFGATPRPLLTVTAEQLGGSGTVTSTPAGINCGTTCSARFDPNTTVTLTARPDTGSRFLGWQHGCSAKTRCTIALNSAQSVTARFAPKLPTR